MSAAFEYRRSARKKKKKKKERTRYETGKEGEAGGNDEHLWYRGTGVDHRDDRHYGSLLIKQYKFDRKNIPCPAMRKAQAQVKTTSGVKAERGAGVKFGVVCLLVLPRSTQADQ